jgi:uncharacterized protein (TIGR02145 family)
MPDGRTWFAQNLNYTKDLTFNMYASEANGKQYITWVNGVPAIGSYWCPGVNNSVYEGDRNMCNVYGALYTWETVMMLDGKYADETKTSSAWDESWMSPYYYNYSDKFASDPNADRNNGRGGTNVKGGGRGICPMGWHVPTILEWATLLDKVDGNGNSTSFTLSSGGCIGVDAGLKLRSAATYTGTDPGDGSWLLYDVPGTDEYGFRHVPSGFVYPHNSTFIGRGSWAALPSSTVFNDYIEHIISITLSDKCVHMGSYERRDGIPARCIMD